MENINCYLKITVILLAFFAAILLYLRFVNKKAPFGNIDITPKKVTINEIDEVNDDFNLNILDTRYQYPYKPPVNPIVRKSILKKVIPASPDLYTPFTDYSVNTSDYHILDNNVGYQTNELEYSGGTNELIKIPLQMIDNNEQLRSQLELITPYNKIKYGNC